MQQRGGGGKDRRVQQTRVYAPTHAPKGAKGTQAKRATGEDRLEQHTQGMRSERPTSGSRLETAAKGKQTKRATGEDRLEQHTQGTHSERPASGSRLETAAKGTQTKRAPSKDKPKKGAKGTQTKYAPSKNKPERNAKGTQTKRAPSSDEREMHAYGTQTKRAPSSDGREVEYAYIPLSVFEQQGAVNPLDRPLIIRESDPKKKAQKPPAVKRPKQEDEPQEPPKRFHGIHRFEEPERKRLEQEREARRQEREKTKRPPMTRKKMLTLLIAGVLGVAILLSGYFVFLVDKITVEGNEQYPPERIVELSGLVYGRHTLLCNLDGAKAGIEQNPYLKVISIARVLPDGIRIKVQERKEVAAIKSQGHDVIIDLEGHVLAIGAGSNELLQVIGMSQHGARVNEPIGAGDDIQAATLLMLLKELDALSLLTEVKELNLSNPLRVSMRTTDGITVVLGQPVNITEKLNWMKDALPSLRAGSITAGTLDVSAKGGAIYSPPGTSVRPQPGDGDKDPDAGAASPTNGGNASPTNSSPTNSSPTNSSPTNSSPTNSSPTNSSPTNSSPTNASPTNGGNASPTNGGMSG